MAYSEAGFGARLENARKLLTHLQTFGGYIPAAKDLTSDNLEKVIQLAQKYDQEATNSIDEYSKSVDARENLFRNAPTSFLKRLTPLNAAVRSGFGRQSQQVETISGMIRKIRGIKLKKLYNSPDAATVSQSENSYGSMVKSLSDLIIILDKYGNTYNPGNPSLKVSDLKLLQANMKNANEKVTSTLGIQMNIRSLRRNKFEIHHQVCQRIKDGIRSQYTPNSPEYDLIKSLKF